MVWGIRTQLPWWCAFGHSAPGHRASGYSVSGYHASGRSCYGIFVPDEEGQGINLLDAAHVFRTKGVKADDAWTTPAMVPCVQTQLPRHNASRRSCQGTTHSDAAVKVQRIQTQLSRHNTSRRSSQGTTRPDAAVKAQRVQM